MQTTETLQLLEILLCLPWFTAQFKWRPQPRREEKAESQKGSDGGPGEIAESTSVSSETEAETAHALTSWLLCVDAQAGQ